MVTLTEHYERLLGLDGDWQVLDVELVLEEQRVAIRLESVAGESFCCSGCGEKCLLKDHAKQREWRHMDTMQFETEMRARVPRTDCPQCGVKTCAVPWADLHGRFTLMFEAFAVRVLQASSNVEQARQLLGLNWKGLHRIMERAVERGLAKRELDEVEHVGMDEIDAAREQRKVAEEMGATGRGMLLAYLVGIKTRMGKPHRNLVDFIHVPVVKRLTRLPVCIDPTHSVGSRDRAPDGLLDIFHATAQGIIAGANMIMVECHPKPEVALCDGPQALTMQEIDHFVADVEIVRRAYEERRALAEKD